MSRYIDADELLKRLSRKEADEGAALVNFVKKVVELRIKAMPTAEVEEVVRCKECKHADLFYPYCTIWEAAIDGDGYCYKGERE